MLRPSILVKNLKRRHFEIFLLFFGENRIRHFLQIVSLGDKADSLHEMSNPIFQKSKKNIVDC